MHMHIHVRHVGHSVLFFTFSTAHARSRIQSPQQEGARGRCSTRQTHRLAREPADATGARGCRSSCRRHWCQRLPLQSLPPAAATVYAQLPSSSSSSDPSSSEPSLGAGGSSNRRASITTPPKNFSTFAIKASSPPSLFASSFSLPARHMTQRSKVESSQLRCASLAAIP